MTVTATGDALALAVLLGLAALDAAVGGIAVLVGLAVAVRWGSTALAALAGGQAVIGPAAWSGSPGLVASSWAGALALVLACGAGRALRSGHAGQIQAVAFGTAAALVLAGPAAGRSPVAAVTLRLVATVAAVAACMAVARRLPPSTARAAGGAAATLALALAVVS